MADRRKRWYNQTVTRWRQVLGVLVVLLIAPAAAVAAPWGTVTASNAAYQVGVTLVWQDSDAPRHFSVERSTCGSTTFQTLSADLPPPGFLGTFSYTDPAPGDGCWTYGVTPLTGDLTPATVDFTVDTTPPSTPTFQVGPAASAHVAGTVDIQSSPVTDPGNLSPIVGVEFSTSPGGVVVADARSTTPWNTTLGADGTYVLSLRAIDAAGNASPSATRSVVVDNHGPAATTTFPLASATLGAGPVLLTADVADATGIASVGFEGDGGSGFATLGAATHGTGSQWTLSWTPPASQTTWTIRVRATDTLGNVATESPGATLVLIDNVAPPAPAFTTAPAPAATLTGDVPLAASAAGEPGAASGLRRVQFQFAAAGSGTFATIAAINVGSPFQTVWHTAGVLDGVYDLRVRSEDNAGNASVSAVVAGVVVNNVAPYAPSAMIGPALAPAPITASEPELFWPAPQPPSDIVAYHVFRDGGAPVTVTGTSFVDTLALDGSEDGLHSYLVRAFDGVSESTDSSPVVIRLDTTAPDPPTGLDATVRTDGSGVDLAWDAAVDHVASDSDPGSGVVSYVVRRDPGASAPATAADGTGVCDGVALTCADTAIEEKTLYSYAVFARDAAGNLTAVPAVASATTLDTIRPGVVQNLRVRRAGTKVVLRWTNPTDSDLARVVVVVKSRSAPANAADGRLVFSSRRLTTFTSAQKPGSTLFYAVVALDHSNNESPVVATRIKVPRLGKLTPMDGSELRGVVTLRWKRVALATYYNVQVYKGSRLVTQAWPAATNQRIGTRLLRKGVRYTWYVWPGFGRRAAARYGGAIGHATFVWLGR